VIDSNKNIILKIYKDILILNNILRESCIYLFIYYYYYYYYYYY